MDKISDKFQNWPDLFICLSYLPLIAEKASILFCHQHNLLDSDQMYLKLADNVGMDGI